MNWEKIVAKLTSRKFWAAIVEFVTMMVVFNGGSESEAQKIAALILAGAGVVAYIIGEGLTDAAGAKAPKIVLPEDEDEAESEDAE